MNSTPDSATAETKEDDRSTTIDGETTIGQVGSGTYRGLDEAVTDIRQVGGGLRTDAELRSRVVVAYNVNRKQDGRDLGSPVRDITDVAPVDIETRAPDGECAKYSQ